MNNYITYHNHDTKSLLDSCLKTEDLVKWAVANKMSAVGVTNHGEMSSLLLLHKECKKNNIKPILGEEFYFTENKLDEDGKRIRDNYHIILLAKNRTGWDNLIKLHNLSYREDRYYYDPRITIEDLIKYKEGLIVTSACIGGILGRPWTNDDLEKSKQYTEILSKEFGENFYLELQNHNSEDLYEREKQHKYNKYLMNLSKEFNIKCVVQNDSHYYLKEDWEAHQILLCKNTGSKLSNPKFKFDSKEYYLKNEAEMIETFNEYPLSFIEDCFKNTKNIADKVEQFDISYKEYNYPKFGEQNESYDKLVKLANEGLHNRFTQEFLESNPNYQERLNYELETINKIGFVDYFLILDDLYRYTRSQNIYSGAGRGSACGSLVLYCLQVTHVDPIEYNLLFERFINPDRISAPDVDCDFDDNDRQKVIEYLKNRYGEDHVCNIATYGEMTAKASFKAVASILEIPFDKANSLSAMMDSNMSLKENYEQIDTFRCACENNDTIMKAYKLACKLEGTYAQRGTHACGLVISNKPLDEICPCVTVKDTKSKERIVATTFEMKEVDGDLKMLKLDILGLRNLGVIKEANRFIKETRDEDVNFLNIDLDDSKTYETLSDGYTLGAFQFESQLMQRIIKQVKPKSIEDLSCITAIARPGCLSSGLCESFIKRRNGSEKIEVLVKGTEELMKDTLQLPLYQENCMQLSRVMAGYTGGESDLLRKCIGKKDPEKLKAEREHFVNGSINNGYSEEFANEIFDIIEKFGGYGFNKSHAVGYSFLSYITAYYKTHYPVQFLTALLNSVSSDLDQLNLYISECFRLGITVLPPDVNESDNIFSINSKNEIRFGLSAIKGLGKATVKNIINARKQRKFNSIEDFIQRTYADKGSLQALLKVGAFNDLVENPKMWDNMCDYVNDAKNSKVYSENGDLQEAIFTVVSNKKTRASEEYIRYADLKRNLGGSKADKLKKEEYTLKQEEIGDKMYYNIKKFFLSQKKYTPQEKIKNEQELLGFNVTINPYQRWTKFKKYFITKEGNGGVPYIELNELLEDADKYSDLYSFHTVGLLTEIKELKTKKGQKMAKVTLEYFGKKTVITIFSTQWENDLEFKLQKGNMVLIVGCLVEANKQYTDADYEIRMKSMQQLNVLINVENKCIIDIDKTNHTKDEISSLVKGVALNERKANLPIEKALFFKIDNKYIPLSGLCWINNPNKLLNGIR